MDWSSESNRSLIVKVSRLFPAFALLTLSQCLERHRATAATVDKSLTLFLGLVVVIPGKSGVTGSRVRFELAPFRLSAVAFAAQIRGYKQKEK
jgi:hypothetical protein